MTGTESVTHVACITWQILNGIVRSGFWILRLLLLLLATQFLLKIPAAISLMSKLFIDFKLNEYILINFIIFNKPCTNYGFVDCLDMKMIFIKIFIKYLHQRIFLA